MPTGVRFQNDDADDDEMSDECSSDDDSEDESPEDSHRRASRTRSHYANVADDPAEHDLFRANTATVFGAAVPAGMGMNADMLEEANTMTELDVDLADSLASRGARVAVFVLLCQAVQMFMSYDGGALPASLDTLQAKRHAEYGDAGHITALELAVLNAMDKVGMVVACVPWGLALKKCNAKLLLTISLLANALTTVSFGFLWYSVPLMYLAKFVMGVTQALQGVWGTVWTVVMSPPDQKTAWLGLGAVSAGLGNGIGTSVAGYGTASGAPYWLAFLLAGFVLCVLWVVTLLCPPRWLRIELPKGTAVDDTGEADQRIDHEDQEAKGCSSFRQFFGNRVYVWTTLSIALAMFEATGIQFLFIQGFTSIWATGPGSPLNKKWVTTMFLIISGGGGALGVVCGPLIIDKQGGFALLPDIVRTLFILMIFQLVAGCGGAIGVWCLYAKEHTVYQYSGEWGDVWLWGTWGSIFVVMAAQNACVAALCGINVQVIPGHLRTSASGFEMTVRNILGFIGGSVAPGVVMSLIEEGGEAYKQSLGLGFVIAMNFCGMPMMGAARHAAAFQLHSERHKALAVLRDVCQKDDVHSIEKAVANAMQVRLQAWDEGTAALGLANELIGQYRAGSATARPPHFGRTDNLHERIKQQEETITSLKATVSNLEEEIRRLSGTRPTLSA